MSNQYHERKALALGLLAVGMWSTVATAFKLALASLDVLQLLFIANLSSVGILSALLMYQSIFQAQGNWRKHWGKNALLGLLNPIAYYCVLLTAYDLLPAQIAQPINYTWALLLSLLAAWRFGYRLSKQDWIASVLGYTGVVIIILPSAKSDIHFSVLGIILAFGSAFIWASYWLIKQGDQHPTTVSLWQSFMSALPISGLLMMLFSQCPPMNLRAWLAGAYIGAFEMGFAFILWLMALKHTQHTARISNLIYLSPLLSLGLIYEVLGEPLYPSTVIGLGCILLGLAIQQKKRTTPNQFGRTHTTTLPHSDLR